MIDRAAAPGVAAVAAALLLRLEPGGALDLLRLGDELVLLRGVRTLTTVPGGVSSRTVLLAAAAAGATAHGRAGLVVMLVVAIVVVPVAAPVVIASAPVAATAAGMPTDRGLGTAAPSVTNEPPQHPVPSGLRLEPTRRRRGGLGLLARGAGARRVRVFAAGAGWPRWRCRLGSDAGLTCVRACVLLDAFLAAVSVAVVSGPGLRLRVGYRNLEFLLGRRHLLGLPVGSEEPASLFDAVGVLAVVVVVVVFSTIAGALLPRHGRPRHQFGYSLTPKTLLVVSR